MALWAALALTGGLSSFVGFFLMISLVSAGKRFVRRVVPVIWTMFVLAIFLFVASIWAGVAW